MSLLFFQFDIKQDAYFMNNVEMAKTFAKSAYVDLRKPYHKDKAR